MLEVTLLSGFLGAGKTTWLAKALEGISEGEQPDIALIVNDFATEGVDDWLLQAACPSSAKVYPITSGCICCDRLDELLSCLVSIVQEGHKTGGRLPSHVYIETSGLADPRAILKAISGHPVLGHSLRIDEMVVVLDAVHGSAALRHQALVGEQLRSADRVVITKSDLVPAEDLGRLAARVAVAFPGARISGSRMGEEFPLSPSSELKGRIEPLPGSSALAPQATVFELSSSTSWEEYAVWLAALIHARPQQILRTKGVIHTPAGPMVLQSVGGTVQLPGPAPETNTDAAKATRMVFITEGLDPDLLRDSFRKYVPSAGNCP